MTVLGSIPLFGSLFSTSSKPDRIRKSIQPLSNALKQRQQPYSRQAKTTTNPTEPITESSILNNFPRPNLNPTLHYTLFGLTNSPPDQDYPRSQQTTQCSNCSGPHSTIFCPC
ncbi:uncharacterized protein BX664DRAFT_331659 [Halteromyces radiatus]|uniref:uncharacterized protein n=1 Tax=Halteromyces radiatus TaxID=101107 RepID=UPI00221F6D86|nr:uncharacterized protein BX664DRAFT_331659 [Halteromyces radiatus]KAI8088885.1 hypothetical protein BX664DRAFT_331659 [Halteromyces radiatus]